MNERPVSENTPPQGEAGGRERPNEDKTRVRHEGENGRVQEGGGLTAPKRVRGAPKTKWEGKCCFFFQLELKERSLQGKLTHDTAGETKLEPALTLIPVLM
ncbi:hypothetical protein TNCV_2089481 [Trichonephila clavipes]|nr:hypothetical protein TNCV_2089481 [Trichonephila clavipes]